LNTALPTAISLTASASSAYVGVPLTLDWSVNHAFSNNAAVCVARSTDGTCGGNGSLGVRAIEGSASVTPLASGSVTYSLTCGGVETATTTVQVNKVPTTTTIVSSTHTVEQGQTATISVGVAAQTGSNLPAGTATLIFGGKSIATASLSNGKTLFSIPTASFAPGVYPIAVSCAGSKTFLNSVSTNGSIDMELLPIITFQASPTTTTQ